MKKSVLFLMLFLSLFSKAQVTDNFSDGNFTENPVWTGSSGNFIVNAAGELQSCATATSVSALFTPSEAMVNASWQCDFRITYATSSSNYAIMYLAADRDSIASGCNGYYVQVGGTNDEVSLFLQQGTSKTKIIDGQDKRTDGNPVEITVKVTRDTSGNFTLYSKKSTETEFTVEGTTKNTSVSSSTYFGLLYSNTSTTGSDYYFDNVLVTGDKAIDSVPPQWNSLSIVVPDKMKLTFSEAVDPSKATFVVNNEVGQPSSAVLQDNNTSLLLTFGQSFYTGELYSLTVSGLTDLAGNELANTTKSTGIIEPTEPGDLIINEIMFDAPVGSTEYIEMFNASHKVLDLSKVIFTTRKQDGTLNTGNKIPAGTILLPESYLAVAENADSVRHYHHCPEESNIISTGWSALNNESADVVLANAAKDTVYDEVIYNVKWQHVLIKNPKGVALEKINPSLPANEPDSWHSAASETSYGTPGYQNSQYREVSLQVNDSKQVWPDPEVFSPDNDGVNDVCFIRYHTDSPGYVANVVIFNPSGVRIRQVASSALLASDGFFSWDGKTDTGKNILPGVYVLYFEMINTSAGQRKQLKMPIVVSSR